MSEKNRKPLNGEAINTIIGSASLESACRSFDEANRALEAEDPVLFRKLEEHARQLRDRQRAQALKTKPPASAN